MGHLFGLILTVYNLAVGLLTPLAVPYLIVRSLSRGQPWRRIPERFGFLPPSIPQTRPGAVWLHAVSVGESLSARKLVEQLRARFPTQKILVSTSTPTGQELAASKLRDLADGFFYVPADFRWAVRRTLNALKPRVVVILETEIWPNLYRETKRAGAGLLVVNGRISDQSLPRYRRFRGLFERVLRFPDAILAQSPQDAERFSEIGAPAETVANAGNLKYDFDPVGDEIPADLARFFESQAPEPLIVAGSTREDEERPIAEAFRELAESHPRAMLAVAPRHPGRFDEAAEALRSTGLPVVRRSALAPGSRLQTPGVLLVDSLGELAALYRAADIVFVGGSLNGWGGHNVLEPALYGKPTVVGPHMQNFRDIADRLVAGSGLLAVERAEELTGAWSKLLSDPDQARALGERARIVAEKERGAAERGAEAARRLHSESVFRRQPGFWARIFLGPLAALWRLLSRARLAAYRAGMLRSRRLPRFTLSIGNLTAGGTGKTPTTIWLAEQLNLRGQQPAVLSRGYRRRSKQASVVALPDEPSDPALLGDEPALMHQRLFVAVGVGKDRHAVGTALLERAPADLFLLDDGFQHVRLARDFDLVLVDAGRPFEGQACLPLGRLREPVDGLRRAHAVLLTNAGEGTCYQALTARVRRVNPDAPVFRSRMRAAGVIETRFGEDVSLERLAGRAVFAFCGLGNPESFWRTLEGLGSRLAGRMAFNDHHRYSLDDWWRIAAAARESEAELTITTEKDLQNLSHEAPSEMRTGAPPLHVLKVDLEVDDGGKLVDLIEARVSEGSKR